MDSVRKLLDIPSYSKWWQPQETRTVAVTKRDRHWFVYPPSDSPYSQQTPTSCLNPEQICVDWCDQWPLPVRISHLHITRRRVMSDTHITNTIIRTVSLCTYLMWYIPISWFIDTLFNGCDSSVGIALGYGLDYRSSMVRFPAEAGNFSLHRRVQSGSGAHPASYPMGTWCKAAAAWRWPLTSI
jgi:hypothetical protein